MNVRWRKSSYSGGISDQQCVELGRLPLGTGIGMRDSKDPGAGHLALTATEFANLLEQVKQQPER
ncbi:DUF397 domain-containing protein [Actinomadura sp. 6K520]|jgi:hypothetical protein|uniref:DUF397 domain-containing protein n=1 Tax=Actinomadura sp. 6K520 TaxID=2530364 RepID=UPI00104BA662|nr:DUF397 domain-containing protein [Actinomadura sp. 6K520]TDE32354.1 DUF397 domain-containing protein [Actinomadura sp. 6K520]